MCCCFGQSMPGCCCCLYSCERDKADVSDDSNAKVIAKRLPDLDPIPDSYVRDVVWLYCTENKARSAPAHHDTRVTKETCTGYPYPAFSNPRRAALYPGPPFCTCRKSTLTPPMVRHLISRLESQDRSEAFSRSYKAVLMSCHAELR